MSESARHEPDGNYLWSFSRQQIDGMAPDSGPEVSVDTLDDSLAQELREPEQQRQQTAGRGDPCPDDTTSERLSESLTDDILSFALPPMIAWPEERTVQQHRDAQMFDRIVLSLWQLYPPAAVE
jgi:hypothetical protein